MKRSLTATIIFFSFLACKTKNDQIDNVKIANNLKQYIQVHLDDVASIDSVAFGIDTITEKKLLQTQASYFTTASVLWASYLLDSYQPIVYTDGYCKKKSTEYKQSAQQLKAKAQSADSLKIKMWKINAHFIYTQKDMSLRRGFFEIFCDRKSYGFIDYNSVIEPLDMPGLANPLHEEIKTIPFYLNDRAD